MRSPRLRVCCAHGSVLITGAIRLADPVNPRHPAVYNSIYVIDHDGSIAALYDKVHLVPFGEYLPFQHSLELLGLEELTEQRGGFLSGDRRRLISPTGRSDCATADLLRGHLPGAR